MGMAVVAVDDDKAERDVHGENEISYSHHDEAVSRAPLKTKPLFIDVNDLELGVRVVVVVFNSILCT
jgi:hypothetical protein